MAGSSSEHALACVIPSGAMESSAPITGEARYERWVRSNASAIGDRLVSVPSIGVVLSWR